MKKITLVILLVLGVFIVNAKEKSNKTNDTESNASLVLSGSVADENSGEALVGVEVKIVGTDLKTYTDFDGNFSFENVKPGEYKLATSYISYQKNTKSLNVTSHENDIKIKLQTSDY